MYFTLFYSNYYKQAWKLSAIKGEPNLSILWEVRQIHLKKAISSKKGTSNLTKVFLAKKQFLPNSHFCQNGNSNSLVQVWTSLITLIKFDQVWTSLNKFDHFDPVWSNLNKFEQAWTSLNKFDHFDPVWTSLIQFEYVWTCLVKFDQFGLSLNQFDPF